jgi:hypothetical protein
MPRCAIPFQGSIATFPYNREEKEAYEQKCNAEEYQVFRAQPLRKVFRQISAEYTTGYGADTDKSKQPFRFPGIVHVIGEQVELRAHDNGIDRYPDIERVEKPVAPVPRVNGEPEYEQAQNGSDDGDRDLIVEARDLFNSGAQHIDERGEYGDKDKNIRKLVDPDIHEKERFPHRFQNHH